MSTLERILESADRLPTMSTAVSRLHTLIHDPRAGASDLERVIKPDPTLTANLLRMANSPLFGAPRRVTSVKHAITLLGMKRVYEAAVSASFIKLIPSRLPGYEMESKKFWDHSGAVAVLAERLATELGLKAPDLIFTAGLLHDVGKLVIGAFLAEQSAQMRAQLVQAETTLYATEQELLGTTHAEVGAGLCEKWQLPRQLAWAARWHHQPESIAAEVDHVLVDLVHVANNLSHAIGFSTDTGELARSVDPTSMTRLGLTVQRLEHLAGTTLEFVSAMGDVFSSQAGG